MRRHSLSFFLLVLFWPPLVISASDITPEMVLGDYRADPLFGQAAANKTIAVTIEHKRLKPSNVEVMVGTTMRVLIHNQTEEPHLLVVTDNLPRVLANETYIHSFHDEEVMRRQTAGTHSHQSNSSVEDAAPIVRQVSDDPALYISPGKSKEMLVFVPEIDSFGLYCVLDGHEKDGYMTKILPLSEK